MLASLVCFAVLTPFRPFAVCFVGCFGGGTCLPVVCRFFCVFFNVSTVFVTKTLVLFFLLFFLLCFWSAVLLFFHVWGSVSLLCCGLGLGIAMHESSPFFLRCFWCFFWFFVVKLMCWCVHVLQVCLWFFAVSVLVCCLTFFYFASLHVFIGSLTPFTMSCLPTHEYQTHRYAPMIHDCFHVYFVCTSCTNPVHKVHPCPSDHHSRATLCPRIPLHPYEPINVHHGHV